MPTLFRFLVVIAILAALVFGGMVALTVFVHPQDKDVTIRVPARDLFGD